MKEFNNGLFIFRRDFRIIDNNGLNLLNDKCQNIYAIFIFTPEQIGTTNKYKSNNAIQFMIESLQDLSYQISKTGGHLYTFYGHNNNIIKDCIDAFDIDIVCFNLDITPYAKERDSEIIKLCEKLKTFVMYDYDYYLHQPGTIVNGSGDPYQKFTPFYETAIRKKVETPVTYKKINFKKSEKQIPNKITLEQSMNKFTKVNDKILVHGGRQEGLKILKKALITQSHYAKTRNDLNKDTTLLSAYIKFGCVSIREVYKILRRNTALIRQLIWREFYANILYSFPHVLGHSLKSKYDKIKWHHNERLFEAWCKGETGFPIVDASQRQLLQSGWTHNRGRMISSSILIKIFLIDWRKGERFYAQHLVDYSVENNNGGWQWSSGGGSDAQPFFRYFNPYTQSKEHDPKCEYIKKWIPELKNIPNEDIHEWDTAWENHRECGYPKPIVNYAEQREKSIKMYKDALY